MVVLIIALAAGAGTGGALWGTETAGWGWSLFWGILAFGVVQAAGGYLVQRKVKAAMQEVQDILLAGQKKMQAKMARWQLRPPGSLKAATAELERDRREFAAEAIAVSEKLHRFDIWVPMMKRQIATAQFQLHWMTGDFKAVDALMDKALFFDPAMGAMKLARMQMLGAPVDEMKKTYAKTVRRLRYNQNVVPAAAWSWILLKRGDADAAFKVLNDALEKSDNQVLKANRDHLANNRPSHFSNAGLGDQWYALRLEEPKYSQPRQRMKWR